MPNLVTTQPNSKAPVFADCPICLGTSFEAQAVNRTGHVIDSQGPEMDAPCFVCNGAKVVSPDAMCICGRAATWRGQTGTLAGVLYCGRLGCQKRLADGESAKRILLRWEDEDKDDDGKTDGKTDDYSRHYPFYAC